MDKEEKFDSKKDEDESSDDENFEEEKIKERDKKKSAFSLAMSNLLVNKEWNEWLKWLQNLFKWITDYGELVVRLFQWSHVPTSRIILCILLFTTVYSSVRPFSHI